MRFGIAFEVRYPWINYPWYRRLLPLLRRTLDLVLLVW